MLLYNRNQLPDALILDDMLYQCTIPGSGTLLTHQVMQEMKQYKTHCDSPWSSVQFPKFLRLSIYM